MSFLIAVHVNEGIVLASDRRTTYVFSSTSKLTFATGIFIPPYAN